MANYILTNKALHDLSNIWSYTYDVWSEKQADKYYELFFVSFQKLANKPALGKIYEDIGKDVLGYKVNQHIIFYRKLANNEVEIVRILHSKMDFKNRMQE